MLNNEESKDSQNVKGPPKSQVITDLEVQRDSQKAERDSVKQMLDQ